MRWIFTFISISSSVSFQISAELTSPEMLEATESAVAESGCLTAEELSRRAGLAVVLARERLLAAERCGRICRDESIEGIRFYPNLFLTSWSGNRFLSDSVSYQLIRNLVLSDPVSNDQYRFLNCFVDHWINDKMLLLDFSFFIFVIKTINN